MLRACFRTVLLATVGFSAPVLLALLVSPLLFSQSALLSVQRGALDAIQAESAFSAETGNSDADDPSTFARFRLKGGGSFATLSEPASIDPQIDVDFLVSFSVRFERLPQNNERFNILSKYEQSSRPYSGWAIGLSRRAAQYRPEVYWKGSNGKGGWYSFAPLSLTPSTWYQLTLLSLENRSLLLFVEATTENLQQRAILPADAHAEPKAFSPEMHFVGGLDVAEVGLPGSESPLALGSVHRTKRGFMGSIANLLIAHVPPNRHQSRGELLTFLSGGAQEIRKRIGKSSSSLWLDDKSISEMLQQQKFEFFREATLQEG